MYVKQYFSVLLVAVLLLSACGKLVEETNPIFSRSTCGSEFQNNATSIESLPCSCTTFAAAYGNTVLFGNNEDFKDPVTYLWTVPPGEGSYGGVYLGYGYGRPQGGINEKGLAFDGLALSEAR
jgi:hypothetical protein